MNYDQTDKQVNTIMKNLKVSIEETEQTLHKKRSQYEQMKKDIKELEEKLELVNYEL